MPAGLISDPAGWPGCALAGDSENRTAATPASIRPETAACKRLSPRAVRIREIMRYFMLFTKYPPKQRPRQGEKPSPPLVGLFQAGNSLDQEASCFVPGSHGRPCDAACSCWPV